MILNLKDEDRESSTARRLNNRLGEIRSIFIGGLKKNETQYLANECKNSMSEKTPDAERLKAEREGMDEDRYTSLTGQELQARAKMIGSSVWRRNHKCDYVVRRLN